MKKGVRFKVFSLADPAGNTLRIGEPLSVPWRRMTQKAAKAVVE